MFRIGQKVVCVDGEPSGRGSVWPMEGRQYTIAWCGEFTSPIGKGSWLGVHVVEINRPPGNISRIQVPYGARRFRPLIERKTDISIFTEMLRPEPNAPVKVSKRTKVSDHQSALTENADGQPKADGPHA